MRVWTNGKQHMALTPLGLLIWNGQRRFHQLSLPPREAGELPRELMAITPSGEALWIRGPDEMTLRLSLDSPEEPQPFPWYFHDALALSEHEVLAVFAPDYDSPNPRIGLGQVPPTPKEPWPLELELPKAQRVEWPLKRFWAKGAVPWRKRQRLVDPERDPDIRLTQSAFGMALSDRSTGLVALMRPGARAFEATLQVPTHDEAEINAQATAQGLLVAHTLGAQNSALSHFDISGHCLASRDLWNLGALCMVGDDLVMALSEDEESGEISMRFLSLSTLEEKNAIPLKLRPSPGEIDATLAPQGPTLIACNDRTIVLGRPQDKGQWALETIALSLGDKERSPSAVAYQPLKCEGPPEIGFPILKQPLPRWSFPMGQPLSINLIVRSAGGPGRGLRVQVSGPAVDKELLLPESIILGPWEAPLEPDPKVPGARAAIFREAELPQGVVHPFDPKPADEAQEAQAQYFLEETHFVLGLSGRILRKGSELLAISVGPLRGAAPIKWMRPVTVA